MKKPMSNTNSPPNTSIHPIPRKKRTSRIAFPNPGRTSAASNPENGHPALMPSLSGNAASNPRNRHSALMPSLFVHSALTPSLSGNAASNPENGHSAFMPSLSGHSALSPSLSGGVASNPITRHSASMPSLYGHSALTPSLSGHAASKPKNRHSALTPSPSSYAISVPKLGTSGDAPVTKPKPTVPCSGCGKSFESQKAICGHMRSHPPHLRRGILAAALTLTFRPNDQSVEDYEAAVSLLMLANGSAEP